MYIYVILCYILLLFLYFFNILIKVINVFGLLNKLKLFFCKYLKWYWKIIICNVKKYIYIEFLILILLIGKFNMLERVEIVCEVMCVRV